MMLLNDDKQTIKKTNFRLTGRFINFNFKSISPNALSQSKYYFRKSYTRYAELSYVFLSTSQSYFYWLF